MSEINQADVHVYAWERTDVDYVWYNHRYQEYWFEDETANFNGPYCNKDLAVSALDHYITNVLGA